MNAKKTQRIVVKVGSSLVTNNGEDLDHAAIAMWAEQMAGLLKDGHEVLMVSSGAIAEGMQRLGWTKRPQEIHQLQAAAAVGQMGLVQVYESCFARFNLRSAQILLTNADLADAERNANARATLDTLLKLGVVPIINENDTVVTDEIKFGDNDSLAALVTNLIHADLLVILTDQGGLFTADPRQNLDATLLAEAVAGDPALERMAGGAASELSKGGMLTKVLAAKIAVKTGAATVIASGREPKVLTRLLNGEKIGTRLISG
uniref:Glutamate 5-kinase n=1 Tax=Polynucleobacter necessarius subsp. necessarius (strain STIR1) TaxID=452638 RepID=B1XT36_POLNS